MLVTFPGRYYGPVRMAGEGWRLVSTMFEWNLLCRANGEKCWTQPWTAGFDWDDHEKKPPTIARAGRSRQDVESPTMTDQGAHMPTGPIPGEGVTKDRGHKSQQGSNFQQQVCVLVPGFSLILQDC
nr:hypothetical protein CFP56_04204 [Quercus suber]